MPESESWAQVEHLSRSMAALLIHGPPATSREPVALPATVEQAIDDWVRNWSAHPPPFVLPNDPLMRRGLLARFLYAAGAAAVYGQLGLPLGKGTTSLTLEELMTAGWHTTFRGKWLSGEPDLSLN